MVKMDKSVSGLGGSARGLGSDFLGLGKILSGMVSGVFRVLEYTLGNLLASAIQNVAGFLGDLVAGAIDAASEMQILELRLNNLNFNELRDSGMEFNEAQKESIKLSQEQLKWVQRLGATTIFDDKDIAEVFTLARSYGFASTDAQNLTKDITNFTAGMGLSNVEMERIIVNFGQMEQTGKVTQRELNDLARGAFVPVNDILAEMQKQTGLTGDAFDDFRNSAAGVDAFRIAFSEVVKLRFATAAEDMARSFKGATDNATGFAKSILGFNILKPVLDRLGGFVADFMDSLTSDANIQRVYDAANDIGTALSGIFGDLLGMTSGTDGMADGIISGLENIATWVTEHRTEIVEFFVGIGNTIKNDVLPLLALIIPLGAAVLSVFGSMFEGAEITSFSDLVHNVLIPAIQGITEFISENREAIAFWIKAWIALQIIGNIIALIGSFLVQGFLLLVMIGKIISFTQLWTYTILVIGGVFLAAIANIFLFVAAMTIWKAEAVAALAAITVGFQIWKNNLITSVTNAMAALRNGDWIGAGKAIIQGMINGIGIMIGTLAAAARNAALAALAAAKNALGIRSPSQLFMEIGEFSMEGMAAGIKKFSGLAEMAMTQAAGQMAMSAMVMPASANTYQNTSNYNLSINSSAQTEPIVQDFNMLQSMAGA